MSLSWRTAVAGLLLRVLARPTPLRIAYPDGRVTGSGGPALVLRRPGALSRRLGRDGEIGLGESVVSPGRATPQCPPHGDVSRRIDP